MAMLYRIALAAILAATLGSSGCGFLRQSYNDDLAEFNAVSDETIYRNNGDGSVPTVERRHTERSKGPVVSGPQVAPPSNGGTIRGPVTGPMGKATPQTGKTDPLAKRDGTGILQRPVATLGIPYTDGDNEKPKEESTQQPGTYRAPPKGVERQDSESLDKNKSKEPQKLAPRRPELET